MEAVIRIIVATIAGLSARASVSARAASQAGTMGPHQGLRCGWWYPCVPNR